MGQGRVRAPAILALLIAGACAAPPSPTPVATASPPAPPGTPILAFLQPPPSAPAAPNPALAACGASDLQSLIGQPRTEIPVPVDPSHRRVLCSTCPLDPGYDPARQTIIYDPASGRVKDVRCG